MVEIAIIILILILSLALFLVIKKTAKVQDLPGLDYSSEASITDFQSIQNLNSKKLEPNMLEEKLNLSFWTKLSMRASWWLSRLVFRSKKYLTKFKDKYAKYRVTRQNQRQAREREIQEAVKAEQTVEWELNQTKPDLEEKDTSLFEAHTKPEQKLTRDEKKATSFVNQLLSEDSNYTENQTAVDISDTYYYTYMEKRYIARIVANPKDVESYKKLGELYVETKNYSDALESFRCVIKLKPSDTTAARRIKDLSARLKI